MGFGRAEVSGARRVPLPPAMITAFTSSSTPWSLLGGRGLRPRAAHRDQARAAGARVLPCGAGCVEDGPVYIERALGDTLPIKPLAHRLPGVPAQRRAESGKIESRDQLFGERPRVARAKEKAGAAVLDHFGKAPGSCSHQRRSQ